MSQNISQETREQAQIIFQNGLSLLQQGKPDEADQFFSEAHKLDPNNVDTLNLLGIRAYQKQDHKSAIDFLSRANLIAPHSAQTLSNLGLVHNALFEYAEALSEWSAEQALLKREQEVKQKEAEAQKQKVIQTWQQKLEATIAELPDYQEMVASSSVTVNDTVRDAIIESDVGPRILYELASDDELAEKLSSLSTAGALKLIGKLEAKFEKTAEPAKAEKKTVAAKSKAPEPIRPLRSTGGVADTAMDGEQMSYQQWKAARQAGKIR